MNGLGRRKEDKEKNTQTIFTKETLGVVLVLFSTLCAVCLITRDAIFSVPGAFVNSFLFGCFGVFAYAVVIAFATLGVFLITDKKTSLSRKRKVLLTISFVLVAFIVHVFTMSGEKLSFGEYLKKSYDMASQGVATASGGGLVMSLITYPVCAILTDVGAYVVVGITLIATVYALVKDGLATKAVADREKANKFRSSYVKSQPLPANVEIQGEKEYPVDGAVSSQTNAKQKLFVNNPQDFAFKGRREIAKDGNNPLSAVKLGFADKGLGVVTPNVVKANDVKPSAPANDDYKSKLDYIKTPPTLNVETIRNNSRPSYVPNVENVVNNEPTVKPTFGLNNDVNTQQSSVSGYINPRTVEPTANEQVTPQDKPISEEIPFIEHSGVTVAGDNANARAEMFGRRYADIEDVKPEGAVAIEKETDYRALEDTVDNNAQADNVSVDIPFIEETFGGDIPVTEVKEKGEEEPVLPPSNVRNEGRMRSILFGEDKPEEIKEDDAQEGLTEIKPERPTASFTSRVVPDGNLSSRRSLGFERAPSEPAKEEPVQKPPKVQPPINREYFSPPFDLLENYAPPVDAPKENHQERMEIIQRTLEEFHINAVPQSYVQGPAFTRYEIMMPAGVSVKKVLNFDDDLKMRLAAKDGVRIEAPIPGKNLVGVEVANTSKSTVGFREVMEGLAKNPKKGGLVFAVGKDIVGNSISYDLAKGPHYLIAGATGSGKSVCMHVMILSLLMRYSPEELKVVLVDPKSVEFRKYEHIPHLLVDEIITEPKRVLALLKWAYEETNRRNDMFTAAGGEVSNIDDYNKYVASDTVPKLPRIVFFIDELADLMEACKKDLEQRIRMIAAKSRSAGIHLVLATQRPSVDVITGTIKANLPSRIALKVMNYADSSTILGEGGAEKLLGNGDMLFKDSSMGNYERYQGAYISGREITNVVNYIKEKNTAYFDDELKDFIDNETRPKQEDVSTDGGDGGDEANEINEFFLKALWLAVNTETVSISQLQRRFQIGYSRAGGLVDKMERMGFVSPNEGSKARRVLLTREQFEEKFGTMPD